MALLGTCELLAIAGRIGEPPAVFIGRPDTAHAVAAAVGPFGARKVYIIEDAKISGYLTAPKAETLQQLAAAGPGGKGQGLF